MYAMTDTDSFAWVEWLVAERERQSLTQSDLAKLAGLERATINGYERRRRANPDAESLAHISIALGYPPEFLPRLAKILPPAPDADPLLDQINHLYSTLRSDGSKQQAVEYLRFLKVQEERAEYDAHKTSQPKKKK